MVRFYKLLCAFDSHGPLLEQSLELFRHADTASPSSAFRFFATSLYHTRKLFDCS